MREFDFDPEQYGEPANEKDFRDEHSGSGSRTRNYAGYMVPLMLVAAGGGQAIAQEPGEVFQTRAQERIKAAEAMQSGTYRAPMPVVGREKKFSRDVGVLHAEYGAVTDRLPGLPGREQRAYDQHITVTSGGQGTVRVGFTGEREYREAAGVSRTDLKAGPTVSFEIPHAGDMRASVLKTVGGSKSAAGQREGGSLTYGAMLENKHFSAEAEFGEHVGARLTAKRTFGNVDMRFSAGVEKTIGPTNLPDRKIIATIKFTGRGKK